MSSKVIKDTANTLNETGILENLYGILVTALCATAFELVFFYKVVFPEVKNSIDISLDKLNTKVPDMIKTSVSPVLLTFEAREHSLRDKINAHTKIFGGCILVVLAILVYIVRTRIVNAGGRLDVAHRSSAITFAALVSFQMVFYRLTKNYKYIEGDAEMTQAMFKHACDDD